MKLRKLDVNDLSIERLSLILEAAREADYLPYYEWEHRLPEVSRWILAVLTGESEDWADALIDELYRREHAAGMWKEDRDKVHAPEDQRARWYEEHDFRPPAPRAVG